jgi:hypothetical protein
MLSIALFCYCRNEELEELSSNDAAFEMFFQQLERVQQLKTVQEELRSGNEALASKFICQKDFGPLGLH